MRPARIVELITTSAVVSCIGNPRRLSSQPAPRFERNCCKAGHHCREWNKATPEMQRVSCALTESPEREVLTAQYVSLPGDPSFKRSENSLDNVFYVHHTDAAGKIRDNRNPLNGSRYFCAPILGSIRTLNRTRIDDHSVEPFGYFTQNLLFRLSLG